MARQERMNLIKEIEQQRGSKYIILQRIIGNLEYYQSDYVKQIKTPETTCDKYAGGCRIGFKEPEIGLYAFGKSEEEAYNNFWRYITELIPRLEEGRKSGTLSAYMENILNYLLDYFYYSKSQGKTPYREPQKRGNYIILTAGDRKYLNPKFPSEKEISKSDD